MAMVQAVGGAEAVDDGEEFRAPVVVVAGQVGGAFVDAAEAVLVRGQRLVGVELRGLFQGVQVGAERVAVGVGVHADVGTDAGEQVPAVRRPAVRAYRRRE